MYCPKCGNQLDERAKFCNKCGANISPQPPVNNPVLINMNMQNNQPTNSNDKKSILIGVGAGLSVLLIIILVFVISNKPSFYFDNGHKGEIVEPKESPSPTEEPKKKSKYNTIIITDNRYSGVSIKSDDDAKNLISEDSVKQKNQCPSEIKKIEDEIISKYGITAVNLCELNIDFAKEIEKLLDKLYSEYPSARENLTNLTLINGSFSNGYIAAFMPFFDFATSDTSTGYPMVFKSQILLNTSYFLNEERLQGSVDDGSKSGHFPPNATKYSPVAHEFGHYLSFLAMMKNYNTDSVLVADAAKMNDIYDILEDFSAGYYSLDMIEEAYENYKKEKGTDLDIDEWRGTISKYALAKDNSGNYIYDETIAESFHDVYLNGDNAKDASKYIVDVLNSRLEG